jgi:hypothetical protein
MALSNSENVLTASVALIVLIIVCSPVKYDYRILHICRHFFNTFSVIYAPNFFFARLRKVWGLMLRRRAAASSGTHIIHIPAQ